MPGQQGLIWGVCAGIHPLDSQIFAGILSRSVESGASPRLLHSDLGHKKLRDYEASISTVKDSPETAAWISQPEFHQERAGHAGQSPSRGAQAPDPGLRGRAVMTAGTPRRSLGRRQRLKQGRDFARIRREGRRVPSGCLIANWQVLPEGSPQRLGVITSRSLGNAVARARARRLLREAFRLHQYDTAQPVDIVLVAQRNIVGKGLATVESDLLAAWRRGGILRTE